MLPKKLLEKFRVFPGEDVRLEKFSTKASHFDELRKLSEKELTTEAKELLEKNLAELAAAQELLWANDRYSLLVVFQAMDAAGKDGTIRHVFSGVNPQGCDVTCFKRPSEEELDHDFLWRVSKALPERGRIGIFNRSHYEEVLVVRVHPEILERQRLPGEKRKKRFWRERLEDISAFERHLANNGTRIVKIFLHVSKEEQKRRLIERIDDDEKNWKFELGDLAERELWDDYQRAYEKAMEATSFEWAPWYVVPADEKWAARAIVSEIVIREIEAMELSPPRLGSAEKQALAEAKKKLLES